MLVPASITTDASPTLRAATTPSERPARAASRTSSVTDGLVGADAEVGDEVVTADEDQGAARDGGAGEGEHPVDGPVEDPQRPERREQVVGAVTGGDHRPLAG